MREKMPVEKRRERLARRASGEAFQRPVVGHPVDAPHRVFGMSFGIPASIPTIADITQPFSFEATRCRAIPCAFL